MDPTDISPDDGTVHPMPHTTSDPKPLTGNHTQADVDDYLRRLGEHVREWIRIQEKSADIGPQPVWCDFTCDFSEYAIKNMASEDLQDVRSVLLRKGVFVKVGRGTPRKIALLECWRSEECPLPSKTSSADSVPSEDKEEALEVHKVTPETKGQSTTHDSTDTVEPHPRGHSNINGLIKAFGTRNKYKGGWDEDLAGTIEVYELTCAMCNITGDDRLDGIPVMLDSGALSYYATNIRNVSKTYDDAITMLKEWFTSEEQMTRLLQQWREITLSAWFRKYPDKSQSDVFRLLCEKLTSIQRQLHSDYRNPRFLRDQLIAAADIPNVRRALKEHVPKTAHDAIQKIASLLSSEPASAGNTVEGDSSTFYGLKTSYGGGAERSTGNYWKPRYKRNPGKKKMAKVKGCWVCGANHFARRFHSKQEVTNALEKLKNDRAYVTAEDVAAIFLSVSDSESDSSVMTLLRKTKSI